jgi:putative transcriptional regulator
MAPHHHPNSELLWAHAVGNLDSAAGILVASHLALCPHCRRELESAAGEMFDAIDTAPVDQDALDRILARIDGGTHSPVGSKAEGPVQVDTTFPRPLRDYLGPPPQPWRPLTDGVEAIQVALPGERRRMRVLRIQPGHPVPHHGHGGEELTMVLAGGYRDHTGSYARGDVAAADIGLVHQPVADAGEPCICVTVTNGPLLPTAILSWLAQRVSRLWA